MSPTCYVAYWCCEQQLPASTENSSAFSEVKGQRTWTVNCGRKPKIEPKSNSGPSKAICTQRLLQIGFECHLNIILKRNASLTGKLDLLLTGFLIKEIS